MIFLALVLLAVAESIALVGLVCYRTGQRRGRAAGIRYAAETFARERAEVAGDEAEVMARLEAVARQTEGLADLAEAVTGKS